jgi:hypothetical protein
VTERPVLRVVSGDATAEEIAAVVAAVAASSVPGTEVAAAPAAASLWAARGCAHLNIRAADTASAHCWRTSFWPR